MEDSGTGKDGRDPVCVEQSEKSGEYSLTLVRVNGPARGRPSGAKHPIHTQAHERVSCPSFLRCAMAISSHLGPGGGNKTGELQPCRWENQGCWSLLEPEETLSDPGQERAINSRILDCRRWAGKCHFPHLLLPRPTNQANGLIPSVPNPLDVVLINRRAGLVPRHYRIR